MTKPALRLVVGTSLADQLLRRGYCIIYRSGEVNYCPGCGRSHWYVGRVSAECAFCSTAIAIVRS